MKKALIFDAYDDYSIRIRYIKAALERNGYKVSVYFADFDHVKKQRYEHFRSDVNYIPVEPYRKNLSYARIHSHMQFAKACIEKIEADTDLIYVMVPPNSMVKQFASYKQKHPEVKIWFDVLDMWPESLPVSGSIKKLGAPVWNVWRDLRNKYLKYADLVTTECRMFQDALKDTDCTMHTVYLCQPKRFASSLMKMNDEIRFLYCGSINHIIDIDLIVSFLKKVDQKKKVHVDIIGDGENRDAFLQQLDQNAISYTYHGLAYDEEKKQAVYQNCHYGINVMKDSVFVGLTMKSLDYMSHGLPLINTIKGDTWDLTEKRKIGFNISEDTLDPVADQLASFKETDHQNIRKNTETVFLERFDESVIEKELDECLQVVQD